MCSKGSRVSTMKGHFTQWENSGWADGTVCCIVLSHTRCVSHSQHLQVSMRPWSFAIPAALPKPLGSRLRRPSWDYKSKKELRRARSAPLHAGDMKLFQSRHVRFLPVRMQATTVSLGSAFGHNSSATISTGSRRNDNRTEHASVLRFSFGLRPNVAPAICHANGRRPNTSIYIGITF